MKYKLKYIVGMILSVSLFAQCWASEQLSFVGYAYEIHNNDLLYSEHHELQLDSKGNRTHGKVSYYSAQGQLIAQKELIYGDTGYLPDFEFNDLRLSHSLKVNAKPNHVSIENQQDQVTEVHNVDRIFDSAMIADAGFDVFMQAHWSALIKGEKKTVEFLAVTRHRFVTFTIERTNIINQQIRFRLAPDNFLIAMVVDPIYLTYDLNTGRIVGYEGLTNLERLQEGQSSEENYVARIEYHYDVTISEHRVEDGVRYLNQ